MVGNGLAMVSTFSLRQTIALEARPGSNTWLPGGRTKSRTQAKSREVKAAEARSQGLGQQPGAGAAAGLQGKHSCHLRCNGGPFELSC